MPLQYQNTQLILSAKHVETAVHLKILNLLFCVIKLLSCTHELELLMLRSVPVSLPSYHFSVANIPGSGSSSSVYSIGEWWQSSEREMGETHTCTWQRLPSSKARGGENK